MPWPGRWPGSCAPPTPGRRIVAAPAGPRRVTVTVPYRVGEELHLVGVAADPERAGHALSLITGLRVRVAGVTVRRRDGGQAVAAIEQAS